MRISVLAAGSRGDIQPYLALAVGLKHAGHVVRFAANLNFGSLAKAYGLEFFPLQVDSFALTREPETQHWLASRSLPELIWRSRRVVGPITGRFLADAWEACQGAEAMIYHTYTIPTAFVIGQRLGIPCLPASVNPLPTRAHPSLPLELKASLGSPLNLLTHLIEQQITWGVYRSSARAFFGDGRGIPIRAPYFLWREERRPVVCCYSRHVLPVPPDSPDHIHITGYWFLETLPDWQPDSALLQFLDSGPAPVYVGFGSIGDPARTHETTQIVLDALAQSGQRGLLEPGWSGLGRGTALSDSVFVLDSAPHRWLFPRMAATVHHGGVGTTAAALRAGVPTLAVPHFTDTHFWGRRVAALGAGPPPIPRRQLTAERLARAISDAVTNPHMRQRAAEVGELIRAEDGIASAIEIFHRYVENCSRATSQSSPSTASAPA